MQEINKSVIYPTKPPAQPPMPEFRRPAPGQPRPPRPDPSEMGLWGAHDPAIYRDPVSRDYFAYCTHQNVYRSPDMLSWRHIGGIIDETPADAFAWTHSNGLWAPDIIKVGDEYRMYCSNSSFGVQLSCIYLAVADKPEGPFRYRGIVVKTNKNSPVNAIDANPIQDVRTGDYYMAYGSFWGGIKLLKLDTETGLAADNSVADDGRTADSALGVTVACRPTWCDRAVEGAYIRYNPDTDYYYIFVSYGSLSNDYNIRVGRSRDISGPYLDPNGRPMTDDVDVDCRTGLMIACGYSFGNSRGWMGPGHNSVLHDGGDWYLCCHIRPAVVYGFVMSTMHIRRIMWSADGWPLVSPENYAGETVQSIPADAIPGRYEWITLTPTIPQTVIASAPASFTASGTMHVSSLTRCTWKLTGEHSLRVDMGAHCVDFEILPAWDAENSRPTLVMTGKTDDNVCVWCKRVADLPERLLPPGAGGPTV